MHNTALTDTEGSVLDPIVAIRTAVALEPQETAYVHIVTGVAATREGALALLEKSLDRHAAALGLPVAIVNRGPTRGDDLATVKIDAGCSAMLALLADELTGQAVRR
jgi:hypothetical protein